MPEGQPLSCPNPSGSPLLDSWTPRLDTTTTTTTTLSPQEDAISIPVSGDFCEIAQDIDPPPYLNDCLAYNVENRATSPSAYGVVRYYDCYTSQYQSVIVKSSDCMVIYSMVEPEIIFNSEYVSSSGIISNNSSVDDNSNNGDNGGDNNGNDDGNGNGGNPVNDINNLELANSFQSIIVEPRPCDPLPDPDPDLPDPEPEPPEPPNPEPGPPEQPPVPPENPPEPPDEPTPPSGEPLPSGEADPPLPATSNINYIIIGEAGASTRTATEENCYRTTIRCPIGQVPRANVPAPLVYINDRKFTARMRRDTSYYLTSDNADNEFVYTYNENRKNDYRFNQKAAFNPPRDNYIYGSVDISGVDDSGTSLVINYNNQYLRDPEYVNKPTVILNIYDVDTNLHKTYLLPPIDVDRDAQIDPRFYPTRRDPEKGFTYFSHVPPRSEGLEFKKTYTNYKEITMSPINETNLKAYLDTWKTNQVWMTKQSPGRLISNRMIGWDAARGEYDSQADGSKPNAYFMTGQGANGPQTKIPLGYTFLFQNDFLLKVNEPILPTSTRLKRLVTPLPITWSHIGRFNYDFDNYIYLKDKGLKQLLLNTFYSTYVTCTAMTGNIHQHYSYLPPNFTDDQELREQYSFSTYDMFYRNLGVPTIRSEHFILKHAFLAVYDNGSIADVTRFLLPNMPQANAGSYDALRGTYFTDANAENVSAQSFYRNNGTTSLGTFEYAEGWRVQKWAVNRDQTIGVVPDFASQFVNKWGYTKDDMAEKVDVHPDQVIYWQTNEDLIAEVGNGIVYGSGLPIMPDSVNRFSTADFINSIR